MPDDGIKKCSDCGQLKPLSEFTKNVARADGHAFYCRPCAQLRHQRSRDTRRQGTLRSRYPRQVQVNEGEKWCPDCKEVKALDEFPRNRSARLGRAPYCKPCHNARGQLSKVKVGGSRTYHLKRRYGITAEQADDMLAAQDGLCAICRAAPAAQVDHDHVTGKVRGLLCFSCNGGLGQFKDQIGVLNAAVRYLEENGADTEADVRPGEASLSGTWPRVIEVFAYRGSCIEVEVRAHRRSA